MEKLITNIISDYVEKLWTVGEKLWLKMLLGLLASFFVTICLANCGKSIDLEHLSRFSFDFEPKIAFDMEWSIPIPFSDGVNLFAVVKVPVSVSIKEDSDELSSDESIKLEESKPNSEMAFSSYPAYMPIYYEEGDIMMDEPDHNQTMMIDPRRSFFSNHRFRRDDRSMNPRFEPWLQNFFSKYWLNGRDCICKFICYLSRRSSGRQSFLEKVLSQVSRFIHLTKGHGFLVGPLREAEQFGRISGDCDGRYYKCS